MTRVQVGLCVTALLLVLAAVLWDTLVMAASSSQAKISPAAVAITVTTTGDTNDGACDEDCSLREAIAVASSGDTTDFAVTGTIVLNSGQLVIDKSLTIQGPGSENLSISGNNAFRVFLVTDFVPSSGDPIPPGKVSISGVTIQDGNDHNRKRGGGVLITDGDVEMSGVSIQGNHSDIDGGGIFVEEYARLTIADSSITHNDADRTFGGIGSQGTTEIVNSVIRNNEADHGGGVGRKGGEGAVILTISNSVIADNTAGGCGGGILNSVYVGMLVVDKSTVSHNHAGDEGGGLCLYGPSEITNSTISGNTVGVNGQGGGIYVSASGQLTMTFSTVTNNEAYTSGGVYFNGADEPDTISNSIVAGNKAHGTIGISAERHVADCRGKVTSLGHNLIGDDSGCNYTPAVGDLVNVDPILVPLAGNGGPTFTHALLQESPAIDAGDDSSCPETDQRGTPRPQGARCDIGAFEFTGNIPPRASDQTVTTTGGRPVTIVLTASDPDTGDSLTYIIVSHPAGGDLFEGGLATGDKITTGDRILTGNTVTYSAKLGFAGTESFSFKASDGISHGNVATVTIVVSGPIAKGTVRLQALPNPISGARITFLTGEQVLARVFSDPVNGNYEMQLTSGIYDVKVEKDGFLAATKIGLVVNQDITLPEVMLLWGDLGDGLIDVNDLVLPTMNMGMDESPWP